MDTRSKIVDSIPRDASDFKTVAGYFDPLHAGHIRRLREISGDGERINVVVTDPPAPILPQRARAELVAGLGCVAFVVLGGRDLPDLRNIIDDRSADGDRAREFAQHVLARHNTK